MDWQTVAVWLVVGCVVIAIAARWIRRHTFRGKDGKNDNNGKPPCCN